MKKVLVIQEDIIIRKILERMVKVNDFDCRTIQSLDDLNIEDQTVNFDLIITDILFEGIAPLEFVAQVKEIILHKNFMVVTNMGQDKIKKEIFDLKGVSGFFAVPLDLDEIQTIIQTY